MQTLVNIAIALALLFVVIILGMGLWNMLKGGPGNTSQRLMRLRVIGQAVALLLLMGALYFFGGGAGR
ncbi:twin transmembrane helix small protein [Devosia sp. Naph2]|uniref:twin transmembrane helix small protein n=1 Tax=Devosia polycyclovorans TaxID=3345148 RepID=UPI0035CF54B2